MQWQKVLIAKFKDLFHQTREPETEIFSSLDWGCTFPNILK